MIIDLFSHGLVNHSLARGWYIAREDIMRIP